MSISAQANVNVLNGSLACAFTNGRVTGNNELPQTVTGNALFASDWKVGDETLPFGAEYAAERHLWDWGQASQLYTSTADTKNFVGNAFLANFPAFKDLGGGYSPIQKKVIKLFGAGTDFNVTSGANNNNNNSRTYTGASATNRIPLVGMSETTTVGSFPDNTCWCRNEWTQSVDIPNDAVTATFGAYVRVPEDDDFRAKNCGGVYIAQWTNLSYPTEFTINAITVKRSADSFSFLSGQQAQGLISQQQWSGIKTDFLSASEGDKIRWNDTTNIESIDYKDSSDYRQFRKIEKEVTLAAGTSRKMTFNCFFGENQGNLDDSGTPSGAIQFYEPFVRFFDSSGNLIPSKRYVRLKLRHEVTGNQIVRVADFFPYMDYSSDEDVYYWQGVQSPSEFQIVFSFGSGPTPVYDGEPVITGATKTGGGNFDGRDNQVLRLKWDGTSSEISVTTRGRSS